MKDIELAAELRQLKVNTKSLTCMGCLHEKNCRILGCNVIGFAADRLAEIDSALDAIKIMHESSNGAVKSALRDVLSLFDPAYGAPPEIPHNVPFNPKRSHRPDAVDAALYSFTAVPPVKRINDFELCADTAELKETLRCIDDNGYTFVGATQDASGTYTVFFRRPARE